MLGTKNTIQRDCWSESSTSRELRVEKGYKDVEVRKEKNFVYMLFVSMSEPVSLLG